MKKSVVLALAGAVLLGGMAAGPAPAEAATSKAADWSRRIAAAPSGGHVHGNPAAGRKIVAYLSYTCPHCAAFEAEADAPLAERYLKPGIASIEYRNLVLNPVDLTMALLARCGGPGRFLGNHRALFAAQKQIIEAAQATPAERQKLWSEGETGVRLTRIAADTGMFALMQKRGLSQRVATACVASKPARDAVVAMSEAGRAEGIDGTPGFLLDGVRLAGVHDWKSLEPRLRAR